MEKPANLVLVIFGASGDLTSRKLIPALFSLKVQKLLPERFTVIGCGRTPFSDDEFRERMSESILSFSEDKDPDRKLIDEFSRSLSFLTLDNTNIEDFRKL